MPLQTTLDTATPMPASQAAGCILPRLCPLARSNQTCCVAHTEKAYGPGCPMFASSSSNCSLPAGAVLLQHAAVHCCSAYCLADCNICAHRADNLPHPTPIPCSHPASRITRCDQQLHQLHNEKHVWSPAQPITARQNTGPPPPAAARCLSSNTPTRNHTAAAAAPCILQAGRITDQSRLQAAVASST
jgi:hypothetical protein